MRHKNITPYISVVFANRNDGYTSDQEARITKFIEFYSYYNQKYDGLFEFVICDWNPPRERKSLKDAYEWDKLGRVTHLVVPSEIHAKLCPDHSRPILDYTARNVCIRHSSAPFILVINQDIFLSSSILEFLSKRKLSKRYFYRADRCDFELNYDDDFVQWEQFDDYAKKRALYRHIRALCPKKPILFSINEKTFNEVYTKKKRLEYKINNIIYSDIYKLMKKSYNFFNCENKCYKDFFLHTNASGDFLIAPKKAFYDVHGFVETYQFYMHLDSYMCIQLFAAGYKQAILAFPHTAFHSHHSRSGREGRPESLTFPEHEKHFNEMCFGKSSYKINQDSWGLREFNLMQQ